MIFLESKETGVTVLDGDEGPRIKVDYVFDDEVYNDQADDILCGLLRWKYGQTKSAELKRTIADAVTALERGQ